MNILFLGKFYPRTLVTTIAADSKGKAGMSNHNFEMSVIKMVYPSIVIST